MKPNLILLTNLFPGVSSRAESWLLDEIRLTHDYYDTIFIVPDKYESCNFVLSKNCEVKDIYGKGDVRLSIGEFFNCLKIVFSDFHYYEKKLIFLRSLRYNLSLITQLHLKAKIIGLNKEWFKPGSIIYSYWADNLATTASIVVQKYQRHSKNITRGHGYEIFEVQTRNNMVPFRKFQYQYLDKIYTDSKNGYDHLNSRKQFEKFKSKNDVAYVGTKDFGLSSFNKNEFAIATCSVIRNVKRLDLLAAILKNISFNMTWHVLGDGPDLEKLKVLNSGLPKNIKVIYHGFMKNEDIFKFYLSTSVNLLVSLSFSEGLPVSLMEAQSFGIPIMSTDVGGCKEICNEETGILIEKEFNPKEIAGKITQFRESDKNTIHFRRKCREYWERNFRDEVNYKKFASVLTRL